MKVHIAGRGSGKTTYLIQRSEELEIPIVVGTYLRKDAIKRNAEKLGIKIPDPILASDLLDKKDDNPKKVLLDDIDIVINILLNSNVLECTCTSNN